MPNTGISPDLNAGNVGIDRLPYMLAMGMALTIEGRRDLWSEILLEVGNINGSLSDTERMTFYDLMGKDTFDLMPAEDSIVTPKPVTKRYADVVIARHAIARAIGDLYLITGGGKVGPDLPILISSFAGEWVATKTQLLCDTFALASGSALGNSGSYFDADNFMDGIFALDGEGTLAEWMVHYPTSMNRFLDGLRGEVGVLSQRQDVVGILGARKGPYCGTLLDVDLYKLDRVNLSGSDRVGAMGQRGSIVAKYGQPDPSAAQFGVSAVTNGQLLIEGERDASRALSAVYAHGRVGTKIAHQSGIRKIVSL